MCKHHLKSLLLGVLIAFPWATHAENSQDFGDYVVHFIALSTTDLNASSIFSIMS